MAGKRILNRFGDEFVLTSTRIEQHLRSFDGPTGLFRYVLLSDVNKALQGKGEGNVADYDKKYAGRLAYLYYLSNGRFEKTTVAASKSPAGRVIRIGCQTFDGKDAKAILSAIETRVAANAAASAARKNRR